jgi:hypothetical protein
MALMIHGNRIIEHDVETAVWLQGGQVVIAVGGAPCVVVSPAAGAELASLLAQASNAAIFSPRADS